MFWFDVWVSQGYQHWIRDDRVKYHSIELEKEKTLYIIIGILQSDYHEWLQHGHLFCICFIYKHKSLILVTNFVSNTKRHFVSTPYYLEVPYPYKITNVLNSKISMTQHFLETFL